MTDLDVVLEALQTLREELAEVKALLQDQAEDAGPPQPPPPEAPPVALIVDALTIVRAEEAARAQAKLNASRKKRMVGLPENYSGPPPVAQGL